jgi:trehalose/maltose transport system permease protein
MGLIDRGVAWLADPDLALWAIVAVDVWKTTPFMALLLLAGLQSIPKSLYEAAGVDGAGAIRKFFTITLPMLKPALLVALIFRTLDALRVFDIVYVMGSRPETDTMSVFAREQMIDFGEFGMGAAISTSIFLMIGIFTAAYAVSLRVEVD